MPSGEDELLVYEIVEAEPTVVRYEEILIDSDGIPVVVPRDQLDITLQEGSLAFQLHPDFEERIEDMLAVRAQQDDGDQLEEDPIDEELANLDSAAREAQTGLHGTSCNQQSEPAHTRTAQARRGRVLD